MRTNANTPINAALQHIGWQWGLMIGVFMNLFALMNLQSQLTSLMMDTQTVMALRLMGMSGAIPARRGENNRMVSEKAPAMVKAYAAGAKVAMAGGTPDQIIGAAITPVSKKVRANRKRLMK